MKDDVRGRLVEFEQVERRRTWESTVVGQAEIAGRVAQASDTPIRLLVDRIHDLERMILDLKGEIEGRMDADRRKTRRAGWGIAAACLAAAVGVGAYLKATAPSGSPSPTPSWRTTMGDSR